MATDTIRAEVADYLVAVKDNQPSLYGLLHDIFIAYGKDDYRACELKRYSKTERNRERDETRID